jgi:hypothetical protein
MLSHRIRRHFSKVNVPYKKPTFLDDDYDHLSKEKEQKQQQN